MTEFDPNRHADALSVIEWIDNPKRKAPYLAFTEGLERQLAYRFETKAEMLKTLNSEELLDIVAEVQANGWEYGTHPRDKAKIVIHAIIKQLENT